MRSVTHVRQLLKYLTSTIKLQLRNRQALQPLSRRSFVESQQDTRQLQLADLGTFGQGDKYPGMFHMVKTNIFSESDGEV